MAKMQITHEQRQVYHFVEELKGVELPLQMIQIPGGTFVMGAPESEKNSQNRERPKHLVTVNSFCLARYPITNAQWDFVANLSQEQRNLTAKNQSNKAQHPVVNVSWYDALEFCARLSRYSGKQYRLPSEAEWEYAARGVKDFKVPTVEDRSESFKQQKIEIWNQQYLQPFHFGETISSEVANYGGDQTYGRESKGEYRGDTVPVDYFQAANDFGLSQMHGQVDEWCADPWHGNYEKAPSNGIVWDEQNNDNRYQNILENLLELLNDERARIRRGGSFGNNAGNCRSAYRDRYNAGFVNDLIGFRLAVSDPRTL